MPYGPFSLDPATCVLHYAQAVFDGLKAFRSDDGAVRLFRAPKHVERLNRSCEKMCIPALDPAIVEQSFRSLVALDQDWVPVQDRHRAVSAPDGNRVRGVSRRAPLAQLHLLPDSCRRSAPTIRKA